jgi:glycosyltransferase involved in cell wall biosynthesis
MIILHTITRGMGGGTMKSLNKSIIFERSRGHEVWICSGSSQNGDQIHLHIPYLKRNINPYFDLRALFELNRTLDKIKPDVVHSHESKAGFLTRLLYKRFPSIVFVHTVHMATFHSKGNNFNQYLYALLEKLMAKRTDFMAFVSPVLQNIYAARDIQARTQTIVLRSRVDLELFQNERQRNRENQKYVRANLGISSASQLVISVGLLEKRKRPDLILESLCKRLKTDPNLYLLFLGDGQMRKQLMRTAEKNGIAKKVHFMGYVSDVERWLSGANILVLASTFEGFPQIAVQAAAVGLPIVATPLEEYSGCGFIEIVSKERAMSSIVCMHLSSNQPEISTRSEELSYWATNVIDREHQEFLILLRTSNKDKKIVCVE